MSITGGNLFIINNKNEETLGELFSYFIMETVLIGKLLGINPFDQPAVEQVKNLIIYYHLNRMEINTIYC